MKLKLLQFILRQIFLLTITLSLCSAQNAHSSAPQPPPCSVLVLSSYHQGYTWSDRELAGIIETFAKSGLKPDLHVEYMDSKYYPKNEHFEQLRALLATKYGKNKPTLLIVLDNPAFEFAMQYRQQLFRSIPIVFTGLNDYEPAMLNGDTNITGVVERQDIIGTVKLAQLLQPGLKEVMILHDLTSSGLASRKEAEEQLALFASSVKITELPYMAIKDIAATLKELKPGTIVLTFSFSRDKSGKIFTHAELAEILSKSSAVPVYGTKEERLGYGIIGGSLLEGKTHGALGAELAVRILLGEHPASIPVVTEPKSRLMLDYTQLKRFRINQENVPAGSIIINKPEGFYSQHATVINIAAGIILLLSASFAFVFFANRRRFRAEEALVDSERGKSRLLETANSEMESFCYAVSHDLQTPLRHIHSYSSIIEEDYGSRLDDQGLCYLERLKAASVRMGELVNDLLILSQVSRSELKRIEFDLDELAILVFDELLLHEKSRAIKMTFDKAINVHADKKLVRVVLDNLIGNAWKYTSKTDDARIHLGSRHDDGRTTYFISDNGAGFDMQYAEKLFAPFQRLHSENEFEGSGIGLATVQRIINRHGGQIWAESKPGEGATFFFTLQP